MFLRIVVLIASIAFLSGGAMAASKAQTADICASSASKGGLKLAAAGSPEGSCCPPLSCKHVKICGGEENDKASCCYKKTKHGDECSCKKICSSCK
jgi:hypothetical protein